MTGDSVPQKSAEGEAGISRRVDVLPTPMKPQKGVVVWFNIVKGYGYITPEGSGADIFVHYTQLPPDRKWHGRHRYLVENEEVLFEVGPDKDKRGVMAVNVVPLNPGLTPTL